MHNGSFPLDQPWTGAPLPNLVQFNEQELSNLIWGLGKLHYTREDLFAHLLSCVGAKLDAFTPQVRGVAFRMPFMGICRGGCGLNRLAHCQRHSHLK